ncbi:malate dehydrogenase [Colletotrichum orchidophilum]|uniref:Malate dehydrogenase n=1 Tax=Colletotrichum orchidophilum TaxID=1209926 RepID=A0A1G4BB68_9PEZI|nr:malate dehydrogenase [Colletotrichum orchidophilum]OHE98585.1 malate dehydrogenase [Colletotrichum orchidophilum]
MAVPWITALRVVPSKSLLVTDLRLYDVVHAVGVAIDLDFFDTPSIMKGYLPKNNGLQKSLTAAGVVLISVEIARKPDVTRDEKTINPEITVDCRSCSVQSQSIEFQFGGDEIAKAKAGASSATTCMAYADFRCFSDYEKGLLKVAVELVSQEGKSKGEDFIQLQAQ